MTELLATDLYKLVEGRHGRFLANPQDLYMGRSMITYGEFSEPECQLMAQVLRPGMVAVEAGSNMGAHTVPIAKTLGRGGMLYAFEPQLAIFQQMCANLALNDLVNVQAFNVGVGAESSWLPIIRPDPARQNNFGGLSLQSIQSGTPEVQVRVERLDEAIDPKRLDLIKADVEGMEVDVLRGAAGLIKKFRPMLYLEANLEDAPDLIRELEALEYDAWWHVPMMFNPKNYNGVAENIFGGITSKNMLCAPAERKLNVEQARAVAGPDDHPTKWAAG